MEELIETPSKNKLFKIRKGYSKTMHNLMKKYNVKTVEEYRKIRKANRKKLRSDL